MKTLYPLSDTTIRTLKPGDSRKRLSDGNGLYLLPFVNGGKHGWRFDYTFDSRRKTISMGTYPATGLKLAREKAVTAREQVAAGIDPSSARKQAKIAIKVRHEAEERAAAGLPILGSFEAVAREWHRVRKSGWSSGYADKVLRRLEVNVFPFIGSRPVGDIEPPELLVVLRKIEERDAIETAHRARENCSQVFRYAISTSMSTNNPAGELRLALKTPIVINFPAITDPERLGDFLRASDGYAGTQVVRAALKLAPMLLLRPGELRHAYWKEFDLAGATWTIPPWRMKRKLAGKLNGKPHIVALPRQALEVLLELQKITGGGELVFRGERNHHRPMSENTVNAALRAMGFPAKEVVGHGFRATARTMLAERLDVNPAVIEAQLAHSVPDALGEAYNRTQFLMQRRKMMQTWADYLDVLRLGKGGGNNVSSLAA